MLTTDRMTSLVLPMIAALVAGVVGTLVYQASTPKPKGPITFHSITVVAEPDVLVLTVTAQRHEVCPADITDFIVNADTGEAVHRFPIVSGGYSPVSDVPNTYPVRIPRPDLEPGRYLIRSVISHHCAPPTGEIVTTFESETFQIP